MEPVSIMYGKIRVYITAKGNYAIIEIGRADRPGNCGGSDDRRAVEPD